jgi:hypothetical protein
LVEVAFSSSFRRAFRKVVKGKPSLEEVFWARVGIFVEDPYDEPPENPQTLGQVA